MTTKLTPQQNFQQQIGDRLREDVGKLIPDDALTEMVNKAIHDMFFTPREKGNGYHAAKLPSWFQEEVEKVMHDQIQAQIKKWAEKNRPEIEKAVSDALVHSSGDILAKLITNAVSGAGYSMGENIGFSVSDMITRRMQNIT